MKPLVNYCRWHAARLRLRGRDETAVWGELVTTDAEGVEVAQAFHFSLSSAALTLQVPDGEQVLLLDEMGVVRENGN
jgi:hypothetical protein